MKVDCQRDGLLLACQLASAALSARSPKDEVTSTLKAVAVDDRLTIIATNLTVGLRYHLRGVRVEEAGEAIFPAKRLADILRESLDEQVHIDADESYRFKEARERQEARRPKTNKPTTTRSTKQT